MRLGKKETIIMVIMLIASIVGIAGIVSISFLQKNDETDFEGKYYEFYFLDSPVYTQFIPGKDNPMTGSCYIGIDSSDDGIVKSKRSYYLQEGKVMIDGNEYISDGNYILYKNYLINERGIYSGDIADENRFDAVCKYTFEDGSILIIEFKKDGTVKQTSPEGILGTQTSSGTYERSGDSIICKNVDPSPTRYLVYKNQICSSVYYKKDK